MSVTLDPRLDHAPCGFLVVADDGRLMEINTTLCRWLDVARDDVRFAHVDQLLSLATRTYYQVSLFPILRMGGAVEEVYLTLRSGKGDDVPVLMNATRRANEQTSDWVVVRIERRGRWEEEVLQAKRAAERETLEKVRANEELVRAKLALEQTLTELKESNWLLQKAAEVLPTCMYCKRVKGDKAQWESALELLRRSSVFLSHGCCPDCMPRMLAELGLNAETCLPSDEESGGHCRT